MPEIRSWLWNPANSHYGMPLPAHSTCLPRSPPFSCFHTPYLHCVILSTSTYWVWGGQIPPKSDSRITNINKCDSGTGKRGELDVSNSSDNTKKLCNTPRQKKKKKIQACVTYNKKNRIFSWCKINVLRLYRCPPPPFFIPPPALQLFGGVNVALSVTCGPMQSIRLFLISGWLRFQSLFKWAPTKPEAPARSLPASSFPTFSSKYCCEGAQLACLLSLW